MGDHRRVSDPARAPRRTLLSAWPYLDGRANAGPAHRPAANRHPSPRVRSHLRSPGAFAHRHPDQKSLNGVRLSLSRFAGQLPPPPRPDAVSASCEQARFRGGFCVFPEPLPSTTNPSDGAPDKLPLPAEFLPEQLSLIGELEKVKGGFQLDRMLRGALLVLRNNDNPDALAQSAQSARELIEKFEHGMHGMSAETLYEKGRRTFKDRAAELEKKWTAAKSTSKSHKAGVWKGKVDTPLCGFLGALDEFFDAYARDDIYRKNKEKAVVIRLDPMFSMLSEKNQRQIAREWVELRRFFQEVAHHHKSGATREKMEGALARLVRYLNRRLAPVTADNQEALRKHVRESEQHGVTDDAAKPLEGLLDSGADAAFFFSILESVDWVQVLHRAAYFDSPPPPQQKGEAQLHPAWPQSRYLVKMASSAPEPVAAILAKMPSTRNVMVNEDIFRAAAELPPEHLGPVLQRIHKWVKATEIRWHSRALAKLISNAAVAGKVAAALGILEEALKFEPGKEFGEKPKKKSMFDWTPEPTTRLDGHEHGELLKAVLPAVAKVNPKATLGVLGRVLDGYVRARGRKERRPGADGSCYWRPSIEDSSQNSIFDEVTALVSEMRDMGDEAIREGCLTLAEVLKVTSAFKWDIFRRLEMHWMRRALDMASPVVLRSVLVKRGNLRSDRYELEYGRLLQAVFRQLAAEEKKAILRWISAGPDMPRTAKRLTGKLKREAENWADRWRMGKLYWIKDALPARLKAMYVRWAAKGWEPEHPGFHSWSGGFEPVAHQGPLSLSGLQALSLAEQADYLRSWVPTGNTWNGPSREGLAAIFRVAIAQNVEPYLHQATVFIGLGPEYIGSYFSALWEKMRDGTAHPMASVWSLARWMLEQPDDEVRIQDELTRSERRGRRWYSARLGLTRLLHALLRSEERPLPISDRQTIWELIERLAEDPDPTIHARAESGDDEGHMGPFNNSLNTVRGETFHAAFEYVGWVKRTLGKDDPQGLPPEAKALLEKHLNPLIEPTLTVRAVYGASINRLALWDKAWFEVNRKKIFPGPDHPRLDVIAWGVFVTHSRIYLDVLQLLQEEFRRAVRRMEPPASPNSRTDARIFLGRYLVVLYWSGHIDFAESTNLLAEFFAHAPDDVRAGVLKVVGHSLKESVGPVDQKILDRLRRLWEWRLATARPAPNEHAKELGSFAWWFDSGRFDQKWAIAQMLDALALSRRHENQFLWMKLFAEMAESETASAIRGLELTVEITREAGMTFWNDEEAIRILRAGLKSVEREIVDRAKRIQDGFLKEGKSGFLDL